MTTVKLKPHELIRDDDGHWYLIPCDFREKFLKWVSDTQQDGLGSQADWLFFAACRVDGPHAIQITNWIRVR